MWHRLNRVEYNVTQNWYVWCWGQAHHIHRMKHVK